jgi:hypothetical protein
MLKPSTRDVMLYLPNFNEIHMPFGVGIRGFSLFLGCESRLIVVRDDFFFVRKVHRFCIFLKG